MVRVCLLGLLVLVAGCQPQPKVQSAEKPKSREMLIGTWTLNSAGYKDGVLVTPSDIMTTCTEYKKDGTYQTVQRYVSPQLEYEFVESGTWSFEGGILTMEPTKKKRSVERGELEGEPAVTGEIFQMEVQQLSEDKMVRRAVAKVHEFLRSKPPRKYTVKDLPPARRNPTA